MSWRAIPQTSILGHSTHKFNSFATHGPRKSGGSPSQPGSWNPTIHVVGVLPVVGLLCPHDSQGRMHPRRTTPQVHGIASPWIEGWTGGELFAAGPDRQTSRRST